MVAVVAGLLPDCERSRDENLQAICKSYRTIERRNTGPATGVRDATSAVAARLGPAFTVMMYEWMYRQSKERIFMHSRQQ